MGTLGRPVFLLTLAAVAGGVAFADSYTFLSLDVTRGAGTAPHGINSAGQVVGTYTEGSRTLGFLYSSGTFSTITVPGATLTSPSGIDNAGQIVGYYDLAGDGNYRGFIDVGGATASFDVPGASTTQALGINDAGQIVGSFTDSSGEHGFVYAGGAFATIDVPGATSTSSTGMNNAGEIVGTYIGADSRAHGFVYSGGAFTYPEPPGGEQALTLGINDAGQIVGLPGFLYSGGSFSPIDLPGAARGAAPAGINNAGQIAGFYFDAGGAMHGFLATPIQQPSLLAGNIPTGNSTQGQIGSAAKRATALTSTGGACDVSGSATPNVADVQLMVNEALGRAAAVNDLNGDGRVNVADVQVVINAALRLGCAGQSTGSSAVHNLTVESGNGEAACDCISATLQVFQPISVKATDASGNPVAGATVTWKVTGGPLTFAPGNTATQVNTSTSVTNAQGIATQGIGLFGIYNYETNPGAPYLVSTVQASTNNLSVTFTVTESLYTSQDDSVIEANPPTFGGALLQGITLSANIGTTLSTPIQTKVAGFDLASNGVSNISVSLFSAQTSPTLTCGGAPQAYAYPGSVLSDSLGNTNCYPAFSGSGTGTFYVLIGAASDSGTDFTQAQYLQAFGPFTFTSNPGAPAAVQIVSGNNQSAPSGQQLNPLVARLVDANGNAIPGQTMVWSVVPAGAAALGFTNPLTDSNGEVTETLSLDGLASSGVTITVALKSNPNIKATFQATLQ